MVFCLSTKINETPKSNHIKAIPKIAIILVALLFIAIPNIFTIPNITNIHGINLVLNILLTIAYVLYVSRMSVCIINHEPYKIDVKLITKPCQRRKSISQALKCLGLFTLFPNSSITAPLYLRANSNSQFIYNK